MFRALTALLLAVALHGQIVETQIFNSSTGQAECSGRAVAVTSEQAINEGGTPGTSPVTVQAANGTVNEVLFQFEDADGFGETVWDAGTWTVRFNITTAHANYTVTEIYICRNGLTTVGSATGLSISLGTTGVKTQTVTGSETGGVLNDRVNVVMVGSNDAAHGNNSFQYTPDQNIDTPVTGSAPPPAHGRKGLLGGGHLSY